MSRGATFGPVTTLYLAAYINSVLQGGLRYILLKTGLENLFPMLTFLLTNLTTDINENVVFLPFYIVITLNPCEPMNESRKIFGICTKRTHDILSSFLRH